MNSHTILVTGEPRSGTSLNMCFLNSQGIPIAGDKFPMKPDEDASERELERFKRAKDMNPNGFWEISGVVGRGIQNLPDRLKGKAIKIVSSGAYPRWENGQWVGTPPELYNRAIMCLRNPRAVAESQKDLMREVEGVEGDTWGRPSLLTNPRQFIGRTGDFIEWLAHTDQSIRDKFLIVDFDDMISDPENTQKRITNHIGCQYKNNDIVDPNLKRSEIKDWPEQVEKVGHLADRLYQIIQERDWDSVKAWVADRDDLLHYEQLERQKWTDTEWGTYRLISPTLWRGLKDNNKNVRDKLLKSSNFHNYTKSNYFTLSDETYTIERPPDIGDLTRPLVFCTHPYYKGNMTHEQFRGLWVERLERK